MREARPTVKGATRLPVGVGGGASGRTRSLDATKQKIEKTFGARFARCCRACQNCQCANQNRRVAKSSS
jgi:hypothetical protein